MASILWTLLKRDLSLVMRRRQDIVTAVTFLVIVVTLFPLAVSPEQSVLREIAPGVVWVAALLATLLTLERLFGDDYRDGSLEQMLLLPAPLTLLVLVKLLAHWLATGLPLVLVSPLLGMQLGLAAAEIGILFLTLLLGTPILTLIGAIGSALTLGVRGGGALVVVLMVPLYVPVLILGAG
ncbi:MAG: heme exporter protein CcmB, partial [Gammaproteobacteria bacterium]